MADDELRGTTAIEPMESSDSIPASDKPAAEPETSASSKRKRKREREKVNKLATKLDTVALAPVGGDSSSKASEPSTQKPRPSNGSTADARPPKKKSRPSTAAPKPLKPLKAPAKPEKFSEAVAQMDPLLAADYVGVKLRKFQKELSAVELDDRFIPSAAFLDTTSYTGERVLANLGDYLEKSVGPLLGKGLEEASETRGAPHTLIVTAAALRAADLSRAVKRFQTKESMVAKFFAKHIKMKESIELCNGSRIGIGVGTPGRVLALIREGALKLDDLQAVVLDMSAINEKQQGIFDIRETCASVLDLLNEPKVKERLGEETKLLVY